METATVERRTLKLSELRVDGTNESPKIVGHAAVFDDVADRGFFREVIRAGAFARTLREGADVRALVDHDSSKILGRRSAGTLHVQEDKRGLFIEIAPPNTATGRDTVESIHRGDITGMSFGFVAKEERWSDRNKPQPLRELLDVDIDDVSVATFPAYVNTDVALRSLNAGKEERLPPQNTTQKNENRLALEEVSA